MDHELCGQRWHRRFFLAAVVIPLALLATGCDGELNTCSDCGGEGRRYDECRMCKGNGVLGGTPCPNCKGSLKTSYGCRSCKGTGKKPSDAAILASVFHLFNILGIPLFSALGLFLLCRPQVRIFRSRQLYTPMGYFLGLLTILTAATVAAIEFLWFLKVFIGGMGIEGRRSPVTASEAILNLKFASAGVIIAGAYLLIGGLCVLAGSKPKNARLARTRLVTNRTDRLMLLLIEPEGWDCWLGPGEAAELRAQAKSPADDFVIDANPDGFTASPSQSMGKISVWQGKRKIECGHQRPAGWGRGNRTAPTPS